MPLSPRPAMTPRATVKQTLRQAKDSPRKIAVVGATGTTGQEVVLQALQRGWTVRALVRPGTPVPAGWSAVDVVEGFPIDPATIEDLVRGCDAAVNALGHRTGKRAYSPPDLLQAATRNLIASMTGQAGGRLVVITGGGVHMAQDRPGLVDRFARWALRKSQPVMLADAERQRDLLLSSSLDWTMVRAGRMRKGAANGIRKVGAVGGTGPFVTHADVAAFVLHVIASGSHIREAPMISN